jgi:hypothetical protein
MLADWLHDQFGGSGWSAGRHTAPQLGRYAGDCTHLLIRVNAAVW